VAEVDATGATTDLDAFAEAIAESQNVGGTGSNLALLQPDPTQP
jgi:hypothetical protein